MSFSSVGAILDRQGVNVDEASPEELDAALLEAFETDLPLGMEFLRELAGTVTTAQNRQLRIENPDSPLGKQLIRLVGSDVARGLLERHLGIGLGLYNCCSVVAAPTRERLDMTAAEQIKLQNGELAYANC